MGKRDYYKQGDYNVICDICGAKRKASECRLQWNNLFVCSSTCFNTRQPQDFVRGLKDDQTVPIARPRSTLTFLSAGDVTPEDLV
jgi:hypothetical protein